MPIITTDLDVKLYEDIARAVRRGNYKSVQQFLEVAAWNQLALEESGDRPVSARDDEHATGPPVDGPSSPSSETATVCVPPDGEPWGLMLGSVNLTERSDLATPARLDDLTAALWGQTNRVLPIAVGVRILAHLVNDAEGGVPVSEWHEAATTAATGLRDQLRAWDALAGRRHGSLWATAFPDDNPPSAHRYVNQFLGVPRKDGLADGGAAFLGLVDFDDRDGASVRLTTSGAEWASLANPIFDGDGDPAHTFSSEETAFFITHLLTYRPGEYLLLNRIAALVADQRSRTEIDEQLALEYPQWAKYISTMRAGALGRLSDLGLLERTRHGLKVDYHLTNLAADVGLPSERLELVS